MDFNHPTNYRMACDRDLALPPMLTVEQTFNSRHIHDVQAAVTAAMYEVRDGLPLLTGKRVAVTAGSRGIKHIPEILSSLCAFLKREGALPFIVPAMGSHGGGTADGQKKVLHGYGITQEVIGVPIISSMDTRVLGHLDDATPVQCDAAALDADYIFPVGRVKPHPDFKATLESGLCKMMAIGLGKHTGAKTLHHHGFSRMAAVIESAAKKFISSGKILCGLAIIENAYSQTMLIEAVQPAILIAREKELLIQAKETMGRLYFDAIDILLVDCIGKEISGAGMDPNITGRPVTGEPGFTAPHIQNIAVLDLSDHSNGNAVGVGMADVVTARLAGKIDFGSTYTNSITAAGLLGSKLPVVARDDLDAVLIAYCACHRVTPETVRMVHIKNTSSIATIEASANLRQEIERCPAQRIVGEAKPLRFVSGVLRSGLC